MTHNMISFWCLVITPHKSAMPFLFKLSYLLICAFPKSLPFRHELYAVEWVRVKVSSSEHPVNLSYHMVCPS